MKIYDFDVEDEIQKIEDNLQNVERIKNSFADNTSEYRKFTRDINLDFSVLSDCIESYERSLLIDVYTYAEQIVKNFYYELLEKDTAQNIYTRNFVNKKLNAETFSPNVNYECLERSIKNELCSKFKFMINKNREEILKYDSLIKDRHRYAHRGVYQSTFEQYRDVIKAEKYITMELVMIVNQGIEYRIDYQNSWEEIGTQINKFCALYKQFNVKKNKELKRKLIKRIKLLRSKTRNFYRKYSEYIVDCILFDELRTQFIRVNTMDLRFTKSFSIVDDFYNSIINNKIAISFKEKRQ